MCGGRFQGIVLCGINRYRCDKRGYDVHSYASGEVSVCFLQAVMFSLEWFIKRNRYILSRTHIHGVVFLDPQVPLVVRPVSIPSLGAQIEVFSQGDPRAGTG